MNNKLLYSRIMNNVKAVLEDLLEIPENDITATDFEINEVIKMCLSQLESDGGIYMDWGKVDEINKNVSSKNIAVLVATKFKEKGYYVYYQGAGEGFKNIIPGTPIAIRIYKRPIPLNKFDKEF